MTSSDGNIFRVTGPFVGNSPVTGEFPAQKPVMRSFDVFFDLHPNKRLSKQWWGWWFETPWRSFWRHCNGDSTRPASDNGRFSSGTTSYATICVYCNKFKHTLLRNVFKCVKLFNVLLQVRSRDVHFCLGLTVQLCVRVVIQPGTGFRILGTVIAADSFFIFIVCYILHGADHRTVGSCGRRKSTNTLNHPFIVPFHSTSVLQATKGTWWRHQM